MPIIEIEFRCSAVNFPPKLTSIICQSIPKPHTILIEFRFRLQKPFTMFELCKNVLGTM